MSSESHCSPSLSALLERSRKLDSTLYNFNRNHVPMTLIALQHIKEKLAAGDGADAILDCYLNDVLDEIDGDSEIPMFGMPQDSIIEITKENFCAHRGQMEASTSYLRFLLAELERLDGSFDDLMHLYWPYVHSSIQAEAFHAVLRMAFGLDAGDVKEAACGLACMAAGYSPLSTVELELEPPHRSFTGSGPERIQKSLAALYANEQLINHKGLLEQDVIEPRQEIFFADPEFLAILPTFEQVDDATLRAIRLASLELFEKHHDFSILHAVTSTCAVERLKPYLTPEALRVHWAAILAAAATREGVLRQKRADEIPPSIPVCDANRELPLEWPTLAAAMYSTLIEQRKQKLIPYTTNFEHTIKLLYAAHQEASRCPELGERYLRIVRRELISPAPIV